MEHMEIASVHIIQQNHQVKTNFGMKKYEEIVDSLSDCVQICEICTDACLNEENVKMLTDCIKLNIDCADTCSLGVQLLSRNSDLSESFISICADSCARCAEECEKHDHKHCKKCAEVCRNCEEICKTYLDNLRQIAMNA